MLSAEVLQRLANTDLLSADLEALTACGGRLVGSASEEAARIWLQQRLSQFFGVRSTSRDFDYSGWACRGASLDLVWRGSHRRLACHPLYWSAETKPEVLEADIVDVGCGTEADFHASAGRIPGAIVLVRHEYPFSTDSIHRRVKYNCARRHGAAGFVIVNNIAGELLVTGSCGQDSADNIPAVGVSLETGAMIVAALPARARLHIATIREPKTGVNLIAEIPGQTASWVVVCAHYDGHDLAESALDNGTGVVAAIAVFESLLPFASRLRRGLRLMLFTAEETGLLGSRLYLQSIDQDEYRKIALVINLDTLAGSPRLTCLTSGFDELETFVARTCAQAGIELRSYLPLLRNSDHFNFAQCGIPALRLIAGFDEPEAGARLILTEADTRNRVSMNELAAATQAAGILVRSALDWEGPIAALHAPSGAQ